ncbi:hypothetical protein EI94DRAFT_1735400 [Lactarius quietus]|nr:hypothetical protein EI94DRAFT_1735400 [Lactarius quietus]
MQVMSLPTIKKIFSTSHLILAVILILKHATLLRLSNLSAEIALTQAELDYQEAKIDLRIQQHLTASSQAPSIELFVKFIMTTDIVPSLSSVKHVQRKKHLFKQFWNLLRKTTRRHK